MKRLRFLLLSSLLLAAVACASPVVPTLAPTVSPTLEQLPTTTIEPIPQPSPTPLQIPVPYTTITPTHVVTLTVAEITGIISTRGKAAIIWLADGVRHFGILDVDKASVSELPFSLEDNYKESGDVKWSPTGTAFIYEQHQLDRIGIPYAHDIFGISIDNTGKGKMLKKDLYYFKGCTWSPDGSHIGCSYNLPRANSGWCVMVYDTRLWKRSCGVGFACYEIGDSHCGILSLNNGMLWNPSDLDPIKMPEPEPTEAIPNNTEYILPGAKILNVTWSPLK